MQNDDFLAIHVGKGPRLQHGTPRVVVPHPQHIQGKVLHLLQPCFQVVPGRVVQQVVSDGIRHSQDARQGVKETRVVRLWDPRERQGRKVRVDVVIVEVLAELVEKGFFELIRTDHHRVLKLEHLERLLRERERFHDGALGLFRQPLLDLTGIVLNRVTQSLLFLIRVLLIQCFRYFYALIVTLSRLSFSPNPWDGHWPLCL